MTAMQLLAIFHSIIRVLHVGVATPSHLMAPWQKFSRSAPEQRRKDRCPTFCLSRSMFDVLISKWTERWKNNKIYRVLREDRNSCWRPAAISQKIQKTWAYLPVWMSLSAVGTSDQFLLHMSTAHGRLPSMHCKRSWCQRLSHESRQRVQLCLIQTSQTVCSW